MRWVDCARQQEPHLSLSGPWLQQDMHAVQFACMMCCSSKAAALNRSYVVGGVHAWHVCCCKVYSWPDHDVRLTRFAVAQPHSTAASQSGYHTAADPVSAAMAVPCAAVTPSLPPTTDAPKQLPKASQGASLGAHCTHT